MQVALQSNRDVGFLTCYYLETPISLRTGSVSIYYTPPQSYRGDLAFFCFYLRNLRPYLLLELKRETILNLFDKK